MSLGERIKALRRRAGLSQEQVAEQVGVSRQAVAKWEAGQSAPSTENLRKLAQVLQVGLEELAGEPAAACGPDQTGLGRSIRTCLQSALSVAGAYLLLFILGITAWEFRTLPDWMLEWRFVFGVLVNVPFWFRCRCMDGARGLPCCWLCWDCGGRSGPPSWPLDLESCWEDGLETIHQRRVPAGISRGG